MTTTKGPRFRMRKIGNRHDYIRRYSVLNPQGRRIDGVRGGLTETEARDMVDDLNERHGLVDTPAATPPASPLYLLTAGEYDDTEILGVTFALTQEEADRTAEILTADRAKIYSGSADLITVRAEPVAVITPTGEFL